MDLTLAILSLLYLALWLLWLEVRFESHLKAIPRLTKKPQDIDHYPSLCVFVPARNEEAAIEASLRSLLDQDYPRLRIVVADDHSDDKTPAILARLSAEFGGERLFTFRVPDLPEGWMGKCHALYHAVRYAPPESELFLFTDADIIHEPGTLRRAVAHRAIDDADLLAIFPAIDCVGFWERICFPLLVHSGIAALRVKHLNDPSRPVAAGVGAFSLLKRPAYEAIGGHEAIRAEVIDDMALALAIKRNGGRLCLTRDSRAVHLRMYDSLSAIMNGFEKNTYTAIGGNPVALAVVFVLYGAIHLFPLFLMLGAFLLPMIQLAWALVAIPLWFVTGLALHFRTRPFIRGRSGLLVMAYPLAALVMLCVFVRSGWHCGVMGVIPWRGRRIKRVRQNVRLIG